MALTLAPIGPIPDGAQLAIWVLGKLYELGMPLAHELAKNPTYLADGVRRIGGTIVWDSPTGREVIASLEQLSLDNQRIGQLVSEVQKTQILTNSALGSLQAMSFLGMGITGLSAGILLARLNQINKHCLQLQKQLSKIAARLDIADLAGLMAGVGCLQKYETGGRKSGELLAEAAHECNRARTKYQLLLQSEISGSQPVELRTVSYFHRCLLLALATEVRCLALQGDIRSARHQIDQSQPILQQAAKTAFDHVMAGSPERYLDPGLQGDNVSLALLTEIYQQARHANAVSEKAATTATELFEELRTKIFGARRGSGWLFAMGGRAKQMALEKLRFLMACLEETNRAEAMRLRLDHAESRGYEPLELERRLEELIRDIKQPSSTEVYVFAFA